MSTLAPYDQARIMLAEAKMIDDVKDILDKAAAMAEYGRRAEDRTLEVNATEIRILAEVRLGEMLLEHETTIGHNRGRAGAGRPRLGGTTEEPPKPEAGNPDPRPTLADAGISKKLSAKAKKMAKMPPEQREAKLSAWRAEALTEDRVTTNLLAVGQKEEQAANRRDLAAALADTSDQLLTGRKVPCIYIDPAFARKAGIGDRAYENHYPTEKWDSIIDIMKKASNRLQPNAWAFIWIPRAHMLALHPVTYTILTDDGARHDIQIKTPLIWAIARALGCTDYSTCFVWTKTDEDHPDEHGTFLIARDQDEILCLYKKGDGLPRPSFEHIYGSNHRERSRPLGHSTKPPFYRKMIADMVGTDRDGRPLPVLEMFCRHDEDHPLPPNWEAWGNQSQESQAKEPEASADLPEAGSAAGSSRHDAGRTASTTSENLDVTAGETAPNSEHDDALVIEDSPSEHSDSLTQPTLSDKSILDSVTKALKEKAGKAAA